MFRILSLLLLVCISLPSFSKDTVSIDKMIEDINNTLMSGFSELSRRNDCYRLGKVNGYLNILDNNVERKEIRGHAKRIVNRAIKKIQLGLVECESTYTPRIMDLLNAGVGIQSKSTRKRKKSANRVTRKINKIHKIKKLPINISLYRRDLFLSAAEVIESARVIDIEPQKCFLVGEATARATLLMTITEDSQIASAIDMAIKDLEDSCGINLDGRHYRKRLKELEELLQEV